MELSGLVVGRRSRATLDRRLAAAERADLSYDHLGSTLRRGPVPGIADRWSEREVDGDLAGAAAALRHWAPHRGIHGRVHPPAAPIAEGTTLLVVAPFGPVEMAVPDRIVAVVDEPTRFGFAYGTLDGHAERGEESFLAEVIGPGRVRLTIRVHAVAATSLARAASLLVRYLQATALERYLDAWTATIAPLEVDP